MVILVSCNCPACLVREPIICTPSGIKLRQSKTTGTHNDSQQSVVNFSQSNISREKHFLLRKSSLDVLLTISNFATCQLAVIIISRLSA